MKVKNIRGALFCNSSNISDVFIAIPDNNGNCAFSIFVGGETPAGQWKISQKDAAFLENAISDKGIEFLSRIELIENCVELGLFAVRIKESSEGQK